MSVHAQEVWKDLSELRVSLIGNKDLKYKLVGNVLFISDLVASFNHLIQLIAGKEPSNWLENHQFLGDLEKRGVILKILCAYITEVNTDKHANVTTCLRSLELVLDPIIQFLQYFVGRFIPLSLNKLTSPYVEAKIRNVLASSLDIVLYLSNIRHHSIDAKIVSRFITSLLIISEDDFMQKSNLLLIKLMKLVPLILTSAELESQSTVTLLTTLLRRLLKECTTIINTHFPSITDNIELLHQISFEDSSLPNIELNQNIIRTRVNTSLLLELIVSICQIFYVMRENDFEVTRDHANKSDKLGERSPVVLPENVYLSLLLLLKYDDNLMSLASLNLIVIYLDNFKPSNKQLLFQNYKKLFPRIIQMLKLETESLELESSQNDQVPLPIYLLSSGRILADLSSKYPVLNDELKDANADFKIIDQVHTLTKSSQLLKILKILKKNSKHGTSMVDFTVLIGLSDEDHDEKLADLLYLLSVYTSSNETYRSRIINLSSDQQKINLAFAEIIFEIIDDLQFLLNQNELGYLLLRSQKVKSEDLPWFSKNLGIIRSLLDQSLYTNCLYLIRSLSRSVTTLRTFYVECNSFKSFIISPSTIDNSGGLITNFLQILKAFASSDKINQYFYKLSGKSNFRSLMKSRKTQMINKSITISLLGNFILDFSSFRYNVVNYDSFLHSLSSLYKSSASLDDNILLGGSDDMAVKTEDVYQRNFVKLNIMQVIKNFLYHETNENKQELLEYFPLATLIEKTFYCPERKFSEDSFKSNIEIHQLKLKQKLVAFDILRNFTAGSPHFNQIVINTYEESYWLHREYELPNSWDEYIQYTLVDSVPFTGVEGQFDSEEGFLRLLLNDDYVRMVTSINYIENHKYANIDTISKDQFPKDQTLSIWLHFMDLNIPASFENALDLNERVALNTNLNEIKSSVVFILINLTRHTTYNVHMDKEFMLFDNVAEAGAGTRRFHNNQRIMIDSDSDSEKGEEDTKLAHEPTTTIDSLTVQDRAKYLQEFGFGAVLVKLINLENGHKTEDADHKDHEVRVIKRFDIQNSYDLLEKLKSANQQITGLLKGGRRPSAQRDEPGRPTSESANGQALAAATAVSELPLQDRPDVNRGGEGYGYGSDEEMQDNDDDEPNEADDAEDDDDEDMPREFWVM
ncbi:uncharacterized protein CANTADRAFT_72348 [Suhomyces tanzawaensis NRRL Y-17324]|uniref:Uncharacterized protein n=1 Tax=Suhomyces tanzawaensis NRRL Y-17324 TaxID=984487 RepID=A0A1E4SBS4_9ASCO|nr:uncharacterized protein CANTADRAFT_72348 [Suhomyces tanzawaensis NRRL Y-17324]ODV76928.1 hypothetical protein CANTADRAFT_72348 [Suhomyces tanzawaensis NRRL Y-17324]